MEIAMIDIKIQINTISPIHIILDFSIVLFWAVFPRLLLENDVSEMQTPETHSDVKLHDTTELQSVQISESKFPHTLYPLPEHSLFAKVQSSEQVAIPPPVFWLLLPLPVLFPPELIHPEIL